MKIESSYEYGTCCHECFEKVRKKKLEEGVMLFPTFIVCSICGNKRCPKATNHELECTNSNETGQKGSVYE